MPSFGFCGYFMYTVHRQTCRQSTDNTKLKINNSKKTVQALEGTDIIILTFCCIEETPRQLIKTKHLIESLVSEVY